MTDETPLTDELRPCPWCGAALKRGPNHARCVTEGCYGAKMPVVIFGVPADVAAWNRRSTPAVAGHRERARALLDKWGATGTDRKFWINEIASAFAAVAEATKERCAKVADEHANAAMGVVDQVRRDLPSDQLHAEIVKTQLARHDTAQTVAAAIRGLKDEG